MDLHIRKSLLMVLGFISLLLPLLLEQTLNLSDIGHQTGHPVGRNLATRAKPTPSYISQQRGIRFAANQSRPFFLFLLRSLCNPLLHPKHHQPFVAVHQTSGSPSFAGWVRRRNALPADRELTTTTALLTCRRLLEGDGAGKGKGRGRRWDGEVAENVNPAAAQSMFQNIDEDSCAAGQRSARE